MEWSPPSAAKAYLDTLKLYKKQNVDCNSCQTTAPQSNEFLSALAAGMRAKLIVEVTSDVSPSTVGLAAAARESGGKVVCILPEGKLDTSQKLIENSGLTDMVEFHTGDPAKVLPNYEKIDFSVVDCKTENYPMLLNVLDVNPRRSVVVANNLVQGRKGLGGHKKGKEHEKLKVRSMKYLIGKGMEVSMIGKHTEHVLKRDSGKSKWIFEVDDKTGEEHVFRLPKSV